MTLHYAKRHVRLFSLTDSDGRVSHFEAETFEAVLKTWRANRDSLLAGRTCLDWSFVEPVSIALIGPAPQRIPMEADE